MAVAKPFLIDGQHVAMEIEFLREVAVDAGATNEVAKPVAKLRPHGYPPCMIVAIAPMTRSNPAASAARRFRPATVIR